MDNEQLQKEIAELKSLIETLKNDIRNHTHDGIGSSYLVDLVRSNQNYEITGVKTIVPGNTGTKIGTSALQKLGFYNATPVVQQATISDPSGGGTQDAEARTAINALIDRLQILGLISST